MYFFRIVFNAGAPYVKPALIIMLPFLIISLQESGTRKTVSWTITVYDKHLYIQCNLTARIETIQGKYCYGGVLVVFIKTR